MTWIRLSISITQNELYLKYGEGEEVEKNSVSLLT